jgi:hypothetical protein
MLGRKIAVTALRWSNTCSAKEEAVMVRNTIVLFVIAAAFPAYSAGPQPGTFLYLRARPPVVYHFNVYGGRYSVEVEVTAPGIASFNNPLTDDGKGKVEEPFEFTSGPSGKLRIEDGKLTVNGKDRGTLASGDRITVTARGKVLVNDTER